jgi:hypothetical protein
MAGKTLEDMTVDELLAHAKQTDSQASLLRGLTSDPETREQVQRLLKKKFPSLSIPEIDAKDSVRAEIATEREERLKLERQMMERDARDNVRERRASIKAKYKLTDTDVEKVEALILEHKDENWSHDTGAAVYSASRTSATPTPSTFAPPTYDMPEKDVWGKGLGNKSALDKIAMEQAFGAWNEIASGKVPGLGAGKAN